MTRKAVLLALSCALAATLIIAQAADSYVPVSAGIDKALFLSVSLTREEDSVINRDMEDPYPSASIRFPLLPHASPSVPSVNPSSMPTIRDAKDWARALLGPAEYLCLDKIVSHESGWRVNALNKSSGAYGLPQALPGSKMASAGKDWRTNPLTQLRWAIRYMNARYGSPCAAWAFWLRRHWY